MAKTKLQKQDILQKLQDSLKNMKSVVFVNFSGTKVNEIEKLRRDCREQGAEYLVAKKTLLKKALAESDIKDISKQKFEGEIAAVFGLEDEVVPAKLVSEFAKEHEQMKVISGILEGEIINEVKVSALSKLPSRDELVAKAVGSIAAPLSGMVNVLHGNLRNLVYVLNAVKDKKE